MQIVVAALMLGLAAGYAWSALLPPQKHVHVPKPERAAKIAIPDSFADKEWAARAADNQVQDAADESGQNCANTRSERKAPISAGQPGIQNGLHADEHDIACAS